MLSFSLYSALRFLKEHCFMADFQTSAACPFGKINMQMAVSMEHWWNDTDSGMPKNPENNLSQCHFFHLLTYLLTYSMEQSPS